jgi:tetratricopeptide (TPR) repeat protein
MADIFVSYTSSDRDWAFWIGHELEALGHTPHVDEWEIPAGGDIMAWMEERHQAADHILCVVSSAYLGLFRVWSVARRNGLPPTIARILQLIPVFIEPCKAPTLFATLKRCDLYGSAEEDARARLKGFLAPAAPSPRGPFPGAAKISLPRSSETAPPFPGKAPLSNIPIGVPLHFMGRDDALAAIETALKGRDGCVAITALHGLRGVGKTTLAAAYAECHRGKYRATWWIRAQAELSMRADLVELGIRLGWVGAVYQQEPALNTVIERLRNEGEGILLIFDNAADANALKPYLPRGGAAKVLVTSNAHAWRRVAAPVEIRLWPKEIGADYLIVRTGHAERAAGEALSEVLGGLPLALEQAAAYCERLDISPAEYRRRFEDTPVRLLDDACDAPGEYHDGLTVARTFALAIEEAAKLNPAAELLIVHAALLAPEPIPLFLFSEARQKFGAPLAAALAGDGLDEAVAALRAFALVDREAEHDALITTPAIRLHRLVREVAAARREGEAREEARRALVGALAAVYPGDEDAYQNPVSWPRCAPLTPHLDAICEMEMADAAAKAECADLLNRAGSYFHGRAAYSGARSLFDRALAIREKALGPEHPKTAKSLNDLAILLEAQGDLPGARPLVERALEIRERVLGREHHDVATSLNTLARLLWAQADFAGAWPLSQRALAIREKALGPEHPKTATSLNTFAGLLWAQGDLAGARLLYERALWWWPRATLRGRGGAIAVLRRAQENPGKYPWLTQLLARRPFKVVAVALANKMARTAWALMVHGGTYRAPELAEAA